MRFGEPRFARGFSFPASEGYRPAKRLTIVIPAKAGIHFFFRAEGQNGSRPSPG